MSERRSLFANFPEQNKLLKKKLLEYLRQPDIEELDAEVPHLASFACVFDVLLQFVSHMVVPRRLFIIITIIITRLLPCSITAL